MPQKTFHPSLVMMAASIPQRPPFSKELAIDLASKHFGLHFVNAKEFVGYDDRNYYLQTANDDEFVLKVTNSQDSVNEGMLQAQNSAMLLLKSRGIACSVPQCSLKGEYIVYEQTTQGPTAIRLLDFIKGPMLVDVPFSTKLLFNLGQYVARLDDILKDFSHCSLINDTSKIWDLQHIRQVQPYITIKYLGSAQRVDLIQNVYQKYINIVPPVLMHLDKQVIHNDVNDRNIIVQDNGSGLSDQQLSIIDFGDMCYSYRVFEVAIVMSDIMLRQFIRLGGGASECDVSSVLRGYQSIYPLSEEELGIVYWCIAGRFAQRLVIGSVKLFMQPDNKYVMDEDELHIWDLLPNYLAINDRELLEKWTNSLKYKKNF